MDFQTSIGSITWRAACGAVEAALQCAESLGIQGNAAVVDRSGNTIAFARMAQSFLHSADLAVDKAYTSASFGFPTGDWMDVFGNDERLKIGITGHPRVVVLGGGLPISAGGVCFGGIGVSGGSEEQDIQCAKAGLRSLGLETP